MNRCARKLVFDAVVAAANHVDAVDRPTLATMADGHEVWVVPSGTFVSNYLHAYAETDPERRAEAKRKLMHGATQGRPLGNPQGYREVEKDE